LEIREVVGFLIITILKSLGIRDPFVSQMVASEWMDGLPTLPLLPLTVFNPALFYFRDPSRRRVYEWAQKLW